ncbi:hypothetical protein ACIQWQ_09715 [Peribacillus frigoritolerans]
MFTYFMGYLSIGFANRVVDTFIPRIDPLAMLSNMQIPEWGIDWLKQEQVALMARRLLGTVMIGLLSLMKLRNFF